MKLKAVWKKKTEIIIVSSQAKSLLLRKWKDNFKIYFQKSSFIEPYKIGENDSLLFFNIW